MISLCHCAIWPSSILLSDDQLPSSHLDIPNTDNGKIKKWKADYSISEIQQVKGYA